MQSKTAKRSCWRPRLSTLAMSSFFIMVVIVNNSLIANEENALMTEFLKAELFKNITSVDEVKFEAESSHNIPSLNDVNKTEYNNKTNIAMLDEASLKPLETVKKTQKKEAKAVSAFVDKINTSKTLNATNELSKTEVKATVAYAVSLTACTRFMIEGAAVLKHSIHMSSYPLAGSNYAYKMYLFAHPSTESCVEPFRTLGYNVLIKDTPINATEIKGDFLREKVVKTGCCGEKEFLKLYSYTLTDHPIVVHLDLDSLVVQPLDDLFDAMLGKGYGAPNVPVMFGKALPQKIDAFFTRDYNMVNLGKKDVGVQGGFIVVRPNLEYFEEYKRVILEGDFQPFRGWAGKYGGYFGAQQIQGLCAYFYDGLHPGIGVELDRCIYNSMADSPYGENKLKELKCRDGQESCDDCRQTDFSLVKSVHFTLCAKPWVCPVFKIHDRSCEAFHRKWFSVRVDLEKGMGVYGKNVGQQSNSTFLGYCHTGGGERSYIPLTIKA